MNDYRVSARMTDGKTQQFKVGDVDSPEAAREVRFDADEIRVVAKQADILVKAYDRAGKEAA